LNACGLPRTLTLTLVTSLILRSSLIRRITALSRRLEKETLDGLHYGSASARMSSTTPRIVARSLVASPSVSSTTQLAGSPYNGNRAPSRWRPFVAVKA